ncbi:RES domain-containing protein [Nesterenkonia alba]|uniref:RES domain-containing protein n=1 Tax=Nesterenkonia alba TaxID=515814 RepID=UPI0003B530E9|nr:RES domain-containing protein [Nesterenkonia alba]
MGYVPEPWSWPDWRWAGTSGRFSGRWDALDAGLYRTLYVGDSLLACLVEVLAPFRPDPTLNHELDAIVDNDEESQMGAQPGVLDLDAWLAPRQASTAQLTGTFCDVTDAETIASLFSRFKPRAATYGLPDFDAAALKTAEPRLLTQEVSQYLWEAKTESGTDLCDGIEFRSRHGDNFTLWAIYERPGDPEITPHVTDLQTVGLNRETPELQSATHLLGITLH